MSGSRSSDEKDEKKHGDYETKLTQDFMSYSQSTHKQEVSNSVGMAVLALKKEYLGNQPTEDAIEQHYQACINALTEEAKKNEALKPSIDFLITKTKEKNDQLDTATLYLSGQSESFIFPLREVLPLVWEALHDHKKFMHHYSGTEKEKLESAKKDLPERLLSFFNCLERIKTDRVCHHGNRNELVFTLNGIYEGIDLIEDSRLTVRAVLKEKINAAFWKAYKGASDTQKSKKLTAQLFNWMNTSDASSILKIIDPENTFEEYLNQLFIKNGINPKEIKLNDLMNEAITLLDFSCDPKEYPTLFLVNEIFNFNETEKKTDRYAALSLTKDWLLTSCQLDSADDTKKIRHFNILYKLHKNADEYRFLLSITGKMTDEFKALFSLSEAYFKLFKDKSTFPEAEKDTFVKIKSLNDTIYQCKNDTLHDKVENFFAQWFAALSSGDGDTLNTLYAMLLNESTRSKITLTDETLKKLIESSPKTEKERDITPYEINRLFLHAIIVAPQDWTPFFTEELKNALAFVEKTFSQTTEIGFALKRDSYPELLTKQITYLKNSLDEKQANSNPRPVRMILLPNHIKNYSDLFDVFERLDNKKRDKIYRTYATYINKTLGDQYQEAESFTDKSRVLTVSLKLIPTDAWPIFFKDSKIDVNSIITSRMAFSFVLGKITPEENLFRFIKDSKLTVKDLITDWSSLLGFLRPIPENERLAFIKNQKIDLNSVLKNGFSFAGILRQIPKSDYASLANDFSLDIKRLVYNDPDFIGIAKKLEENVLLFIKKYHLDLKELILNNTQLFDLLQAIPDEKRLAFFKENHEILGHLITPGDVRYFSGLFSARDKKDFIQFLESSGSVIHENIHKKIMDIIQEYIKSRANDKGKLNWLSEHFRNQDLTKLKLRNADYLGKNIAQDYNAVSILQTLKLARDANMTNESDHKKTHSYGRSSDFEKLLSKIEKILAESMPEKNSQASRKMG